MEFMNEIVTTLNSFIWTYILIGMLLILGVYFTVKTKFVQFRFFKEQFRLLKDGNSKESKKGGNVSSFQAFCISTASRVGVGNIAGIAMAVVNGGPGAVFWMWIVALVGSASSFVESTLAQIYKVKDDKAFRGGPAYYMEKGLNKKWMGLTFSVLITICYGFIFNAVQSNTIAASFSGAFGVNKIFIGLTISILTAIVVFGGVQRIAKATEILVPILAVLYIAVSIFVVLVNITQFPSILKLIFENAFGFREIASGTFGGMILVGVQRGLFSNEAGMGSAPNAAATANTSHPVKQGLIQSLSVFIDTMIICSSSAFMVLLYSGYSTSKNSGIELAQEALTHHIGSIGGIFLAICILLFAFSSIVGNYYYGESNIEFMSSNKTVLNIFRVLVVAMVMFGSLAKVEIVWNLADLFMALMAIINLIAIAFLGKFAFKALDDYTKQKKTGIKEPIFNASSIPELENVTEWKNSEIKDIV